MLTDSIWGDIKYQFRYGNMVKKLLFLIEASERLGLSGVNLKDETTEAGLEDSRQGNFMLD